MNKYLEAFAYLLAGSFLLTASYRAGLGLLLTSGFAGIGPDFVLFLGINLVGFYLSLVAILFFIGAISREINRWFRSLGRRKAK